jgi:hypothetical protein
MPYGAGLWLWNLLNAGVLCASIAAAAGRAATGALLIVLLEAVGAIQNTQVNARWPD